MDSGTISDIRNITITKSWLNRKRDKRRHNLLFTQNSPVKISSSIPELRKSPRVKISREEDSRVAQFATYRLIWQPCYCESSGSPGSACVMRHHCSIAYTQSLYAIISLLAVGLVGNLFYGRPSYN